jgi:hypothetical protein
MRSLDFFEMLLRLIAETLRWRQGRNPVGNVLVGGVEACREITASEGRHFRGKQNVDGMNVDPVRPFLEPISLFPDGL